jgi:hypothetical protein
MALDQAAAWTLLYHTIHNVNQESKLTIAREHTAAGRRNGKAKGI